MKLVARLLFPEQSLGDLILSYVKKQNRNAQYFSEHYNIQNKERSKLKRENMETKRVENVPWCSCCSATRHTNSCLHYFD